MADKNGKLVWLKLQHDFFSSKRIKKLRKLAGGDTYTIIYLKMQLLSLKDNGYLKFDNVEDSFEEELALDLDEDVENVKVTLAYLMACGLMETSDNVRYFLPYVEENTGSETKWAEYKRKERLDNVQLRSNENPRLVQNSPIEKEKEIEKDIDTDKEAEGEKEKNISSHSYTHIRADKIYPLTGFTKDDFDNL